MKKSDITDEMLVALADGELDEKDASELYALILEDEAALEKFASFAETGALLKVLAKPGLAASGGSNIVSLPNGSTAPRRSLQIRDAFQIAAALLIGIIAGPFIIKQFEVYTSSGRQQVVASNYLAPGGLREIYQIRGRESGALELGIKTSEGDGLTFAGGEFDFDQTFKLVLLSPVSGKVSVFEILGDGRKKYGFRE